MQENGEPYYDYTYGFGAAQNHGDGQPYEEGADDLLFYRHAPSFDPQGHHVPPNPAQQPTSRLHSRHPSAAPTHHQVTQQLFLPSPTLEGATLGPPSHANRHHSIPPRPSRQASLQLPPTSRQGSVEVNPPPGAYNMMDQYRPQDEVVGNEQNDIEEELRPQRRRYTSIVEPSSGSENPPPKRKRRARQVPQTPIRPQDAGTTAGPSTGTRSRVRRANPKITMTSATPTIGHEQQWSRRRT